MLRFCSFKIKMLNLIIVTLAFRSIITCIDKSIIALNIFFPSKECAISPILVSSALLWKNFTIDGDSIVAPRQKETKQLMPQITTIPKAPAKPITVSSGIDWVGGAWGAGEGEVEVHSEVAAMEETAVEGGASVEVARGVRVEKEVEKEALVNRVEREAMVEDYGDWAEAPESVMTVASWGPVAIREACLGGVTAWGGASAVEAMEELAKTGVHFPCFSPNIAPLVPAFLYHEMIRQLESVGAPLEREGGPREALEVVRALDWAPVSEARSVAQAEALEHPMDPRGSELDELLELSISPSVPVDNSCMGASFLICGAMYRSALTESEKKRAQDEVRAFHVRAYSQSIELLRPVYLDPLAAQRCLIKARSAILQRWWRHMSIAISECPYLDAYDLPRQMNEVVHSEEVAVMEEMEVEMVDEESEAALETEEAEAAAVEAANEVGGLEGLMEAVMVALVVAAQDTERWDQFCT
ncbi:MAG: hypothetical protein SGPRY_004187 [Prymnesium sp.]